MVTARELLAASATSLETWKPLGRKMAPSKRCCTCGVVKRIEEFNGWIEKKPGGGERLRRESSCKSCSAAKHKARRARAKEVQA